MSKETKDNGLSQFQKTIKDHLDKVAKEDPLFSKSYAKKAKSIEECCRYIIREVKALGRIAFERGEIFGMAMHYYDEDNIKVSKERHTVNIVSPGKAPKRKTKAKTPVKPPVKERVQLELF